MHVISVPPGAGAASRLSSRRSRGRERSSRRGQAQCPSGGWGQTHAGPCRGFEALQQAQLVHASRESCASRWGKRSPGLQFDVGQPHGRPARQQGSCRQQAHTQSSRRGTSHARVTRKKARPPVSLACGMAERLEHTCTPAVQGPAGDKWATLAGTHDHARRTPSSIHGPWDGGWGLMIGAAGRAPDASGLQIEAATHFSHLVGSFRGGRRFRAERVAPVPESSWRYFLHRNRPGFARLFGARASPKSPPKVRTTSEWSTGH
jgi:hypothetical protein